MSMLESKNFNEASKDDHWVQAMNDEIDQIEKNNTWEMVKISLVPNGSLRTK
jgi:hypothetical protein